MVAHLDHFGERIQRQFPQPCQQCLVLGSVAASQQVHRDIAPGVELARLETLAALSRNRVQQLIFLSESHGPRYLPFIMALLSGISPGAYNLLCEGNSLARARRRLLQ